MKTKNCHTCQQEKIVLYRIQVEKGKTWIFVCDDCIKGHKTKPNYRYGGTWKGKRH